MHNPLVRRADYNLICVSGIHPASNTVVIAAQYAFLCIHNEEKQITQGKLPLTRGIADVGITSLLRRYYKTGLLCSALLSSVLTAQANAANEKVSVGLK